MSADKLYPLIENMLDWTAKRQQTLSANLANMDTPGYKAKDVSFIRAAASLAMETTSSDAPSTDHQTPKLRDIMKSTTKRKANGNNVDIDREMTELTKNGLQYVALDPIPESEDPDVENGDHDGGNRTK